MNSRERLLAALRHQPVDRTPISTYELVGWNPDAWENQQPAYRGLMDLIRAKTDCLYMCYFSAPNLALKTTASEWQEGPNSFRRETWHTPRGDLTTLTRRDPGLNTTWILEHLLKSDEDVAAFLSQPIEPGPVDMSELATIRTRLGDDKGVPLVDIGDPICAVASLFDLAEFLRRAFEQPEQIIALLEHLAPSIYWQLEQELKQGAGPVFRIYGPEYATPPYLPPRLFERYVVRYTEPLVRMIHEHGQYARIHSHGRIRQVLPMIVEMGADALDPVEAPPSGDITLAEVKKLYGERLCLMGNIQLRDLETLPAEEMRRVVRETVETGMPGGGFVLLPTACPINADLSPITERNYRIMIETALEYRP